MAIRMLVNVDTHIHLDVATYVDVDGDLGLDVGTHGDVDGDVDVNGCAMWWWVCCWCVGVLALAL